MGTEPCAGRQGVPAGDSARSVSAVPSAADRTIAAGNCRPPARPFVGAAINGLTRSTSITAMHRNGLFETSRITFAVIAA